MARLAAMVAIAALAVIRFLAIDSGSHSASDTLRPWLIEMAAVALLATVAILAIDRLSRSRG